MSYDLKALNDLLQLLNEAPCTCPEHETGIGMLPGHDDTNQACYKNRAKVVDFGKLTSPVPMMLNALRAAHDAMLMKSRTTPTTRAFKMVVAAIEAVEGPTKLMPEIPK